MRMFQAYYDVPFSSVEMTEEELRSNFNIQALFCTLYSSVVATSWRLGLLSETFDFLIMWKDRYKQLHMNIDAFLKGMHAYLHIYIIPQHVIIITHIKNKVDLIQDVYTTSSCSLV